jgi:hypothetical protein
MLPVIPAGFNYGADRVHRQLRRDGIRVGRTTLSATTPLS